VSVFIRPDDDPQSQEDRISTLFTRVGLAERPQKECA